MLVSTAFQYSCFWCCRSLKHLRELDLHEGLFDDTGLCLLTGRTALRSLKSSSCNNITDAGLKALVVPLSRHSLSHVSVGGCRICRLTALSLVSPQSPFWQHRQKCNGILAQLSDPAIKGHRGQHHIRGGIGKAMCLCRRTTWVRSAAMWRA